VVDTNYQTIWGFNKFQVRCFFAQADAARVSPAIGLIESLGFEVSLHQLTATRAAVDAAPLGDGYVGDFGRTIRVLFLSSACLDAGWVQQLQQSAWPAYDSSSSLIVHLQPMPPGHKLVSSLAPLPVLLAYTDSNDAFQLRLAKALLELLDSQADELVPVTDEDDNLTRMLPASLVISCAGKEHVIPQDFRGLVTVGRGTSCQICLDSSFVSRLHGCFRYHNGQFSYRDMSSNGTVLLFGHEEVLVQEMEVDLPASARLRIGDMVLSIAISGA
jgi:hypothetical protein